MAKHEHWMQVCIELARQAGNPPVGALLVKEDKVMGQGREAGKSKQDITCHAEIEAIRDAMAQGHSESLPACILYTTHEPCIMCSYVIRHHKIATIIIGVEVAHIGGSSSIYPVLETRDIAIWADPPKILKGVLKEECERLTIAYQ